MTHLRLSQIRRITTAGTEMLDEAFAALTEDHLLPCPVGYPYVRVGRDYEGGDVMSGARWQDFCQVLDETFPSWFQPTKPGGFPRWYSSHMAISLLEAVIARIGRWDGPYTGSNPQARRLILLLLRYLETERQEVACAILVGHLSTEGERELEVGGLTLSPITSFRELGEVTRLIPTAPAAANRELPRHFARPECWATARASGIDPFHLGEVAEAKVERFLLAIHLLYHGSAQPVYRVVGETSEICQRHADLTPLRYSSSPVALRPTVLSEAHGPAIAGVLDLYDRVRAQRKGHVVPPLDMAIIKFSGSFLPCRWYEAVVDLMTALEATLSGVDRLDIVLRVCNRAATLLTTISDPPSSIFGDLKKLYDMRSTLVHGSAVSQKDLKKWTTTLSTFRPSPWPGVVMERATDRLRDLVRRALLARLALCDTGTWPLDDGGILAIDQELADPAKAARWYDTWQSLIQTIEPLAVERTEPLLDAIDDNYPGKDRR